VNNSKSVIPSASAACSGVGRSLSMEKLYAGVVSTAVTKSWTPTLRTTEDRRHNKMFRKIVCQSLETIAGSLAAGSSFAPVAGNRDRFNRRRFNLDRDQAV
jgi:hypothetical protein